MDGERSFGDIADFDDNEEARAIVVELSLLDESTVPAQLGALVDRARRWRRLHVSVVE